MNTATQTIKVYDKIIELIARGTTPKSVINFHLSDTAQNRLEDLIYAVSPSILLMLNRSLLSF
jgi:hypothetical protein